MNEELPLNLEPVWEDRHPDTCADFLSHNEKLWCRVEIGLAPSGLSDSIRLRLFRKTMFIMQGESHEAWHPVDSLTLSEIRSHCELMRRVLDWCEENPGHPMSNHGSAERTYFKVKGEIPPLGLLDSK